MDALARLRSSPATTGIFLDFDGTLAPIVAAAEDARPLPGVGELLLQLDATFGVVAIVSGRPVAYLAAHLPTALEMHGLYGLETSLGGVPAQHTDALAWRAAVDAVVAAVRADGPDGIDIEPKGLSLTLHFRRHPEIADAALAWATAAADRSGLELRTAKMSLELHPPVAVDKGTVVEARAAGMTAACYIGDDRGDLPAFAALDRLAAAGVATVKVAVLTSDADPELLAQADEQVGGPSGALAFLRALVP
ncbi:MAG: trehalose-phosphatase [Acidimicrobiales bacterium]